MTYDEAIRKALNDAAESDPERADAARAVLDRIAGREIRMLDLAGIRAALGSSIDELVEPECREEEDGWEEARR